MKTINKRIKDEKLEVVYIFDEESDKGNPTKESIVLTIVIDETDYEGYYKIGVALKLPNDEFIPRVGKAIAYRNLKVNQFEIESKDKSDLISSSTYYFDYVGKKLNKSIKKRLEHLFNEYFVEEYFEN